jgi:hypothetical protein
MDKLLEDDAEDPSDPRLIPGIYNYCLTRCDQCAFTNRCLTFRQMRADEMRHPGHSVVEQAGANAARTFDLLKTWCGSAGIDFDRLHEDARSEHAAREQARLEAGVERDPIHQLAIAYTKAAFELVSSLDALAPFHEWPASVGEALATIGWHAGLVSAKVDRALHGCAESGGDECRGSDRVQNDWNGSAKVARLAIAESLRAWDTLLLIGQAPPDAPLRKTRELLDRIDRELASRFPEAMDFVRPGFDEPDVAAGALATGGGDEPRPRLRGVRAWLQRVAVGWPRRS